MIVTQRGREIKQSGDGQRNDAVDAEDSPPDRPPLPPIFWNAVACRALPVARSAACRRRGYHLEAQASPTRRIKSDSSRMPTYSDTCMSIRIHYLVRLYACRLTDRRSPGTSLT